MSGARDRLRRVLRARRGIRNEEPAAPASPTAEFDRFVSGAAAATGAEPPPGVTAGLDEEHRDAVDHVLRLVGAHRITHSLNRNGDVVVAADAGERVVLLQPRTLAGDEWISAVLPLRIGIPGRQLSPEEDAAVEAVAREANRYYGAKCLRHDDAIVLMADLPARGLSPETLLNALRRLVWVAGDVDDDLTSLPGRPPPTPWDRRPVSRWVTGAPGGVEDASRTD